MLENLPIEHHKWTVARRFIFLMMISYTFLYFSQFLFDELTLWVGKSILKIHDLEKMKMTGSGDTTFNYVQFLTVVMISFILTPILFVFDRHRYNYDKLLYWYFVGLRYFLIMTMTSYGFAKVFQSQFPFPSLGRLEETYGDSSPMGLLWTFMGYSSTYNVFTGIVELSGGLLLFHRRTVSLGAIIVILAMSNILMLNLCYDVPVKLFSSHLILFSILLIIPNLRAICRFFILAKETSLWTINLHIQSETLRESYRKVRIVFKSLFLCIVIFLAFRNYINMSAGGHSIKPPLYGIYKTEIFVSNGDTLLPLATDTNRWNKVIIDGSYAKVIAMTDTAMYYKVSIDTISKTINFEFPTKKGQIQSSNLNYTNTKRYLHISGKWKNDSISVKLHKINLNKYLLVNRGFHWINEYPYNR